MAQTVLQIVIEGKVKGIKTAEKQLEDIGKEAKKTSQRLQAVKKANNDLTISFKRLFQIVFLYVGAFETLHKVLNITGDSIATMVNYNRELEKMMYGLATTLSMVADVDVGGRKLSGLKEYLYMLQLSKDLVEEIRQKSMQAFVPMDTTVETFRAIVGFVLQAKGTLKDAVDLSIKFSQAVQSLQLPMNQVVQEARDLLQGGIQPASSTLATILGINDEILNQWKEQGILLDKLKEKLKDLEFAISKQYETLEGKLFVLREYTKRALGEGGRPLFQAFKFMIDDLIKSLFIVEKKVKEINGQKLTLHYFKPKPEFLNFIKGIANSLAYLMLRFYAVGKAIYEFYKQNEELVKSIANAIKWFIELKIVMFTARSVINNLNNVINTTKNTYDVFIKTINLSSNTILKIISIIRLLAFALTTDFSIAIATVSKLWKSFWNFMEKRPFMFAMIFAGIVPLIKGILEGVINQIKLKFSDVILWMKEKAKEFLPDKIVNKIFPNINFIEMNKEGKPKGILDYIKKEYNALFRDLKWAYDNITGFVEEKLGMKLPKPVEAKLQDLMKKFEQFKKESKQIGKKLGKLIYTGGDPNKDLAKQYKEILKTYDDIRDMQIELIKYYNKGNITLQERIAILKSYKAMLQYDIESDKFKQLDIQQQLDLLKRYNQARAEIERLKTLAETLRLEKQYTELDLTRMPLRDYYMEKIRLIDKLITVYEIERNKVDEMSEKYLELTKNIKQLNEEKKQLIQQYKEYFGTLRDGFRDALDEVYKQYTQYAIGIETVSELITRTQQYLAESLYKFVTWQLKSFKDFVREFANIVLRILIDMLTKLMVFKIFQAVGFIPMTKGVSTGTSINISSGYNAQASLKAKIGSSLTFHSGGLVRKYHFGGLASDEVPAILQTGEYVVSRKGVEFLDKINRGQLPIQPSQPVVIAVNYNIQALDSRSFEEYVRANKGALIKPIIDDITKNGAVIKSIRSKL